MRIPAKVVINGNLPEHITAQFVINASLKWTIIVLGLWIALA